MCQSNKRLLLTIVTGRSWGSFFRKKIIVGFHVPIVAEFLAVVLLWAEQINDTILCFRIWETGSGLNLAPR